MYRCHWNHDILPHWTAQENAKYDIGKIYQPPEDVGSNYYPKHGPYSSADKQIIAKHFNDLLSINISVQN